MSKQLSPMQWKNCFKKYESYSQPKFWNYYARFKPNRIVNKDHKKQFKNIYNAYKRGETSIIHSMSRRKKRVKSKRKGKLIEIFLHENKRGRLKSLRIYKNNHKIGTFFAIFEWLIIG